MAKPDYLHFFIDPNRCIGCQACMQACSECDTHRGESMIHLEYVNRAESVQTVPVVCMHCEQPTCAEVCPADAIKRTADGVVQSARRPRCIACGNCVVACPFGVPEVYESRGIMMKCDMCYDRTSVGTRPMCATVCPSQALYYGPLEEIRRSRQGVPINEWSFGGETEVIRWEGGLATMQVPSDEPVKTITKYRKVGEHTFREIRKDGTLGERMTFDLGPDGQTVAHMGFNPTEVRS